jgi:hypothetical protein
MDSSGIEKIPALPKLAQIAEGSFYALILGLLAVVSGNTGPLGVIPQSILFNGINPILDRIIRGEHVAKDELDRVVEESNIDKLLKEHEQTQALLGRLFRRFDKLQLFL